LILSFLHFHDGEIGRQLENESIIAHRQLQPPAAASKGDEATWFLVLHSDLLISPTALSL
jgi:hypothetical protein